MACRRGVAFLSRLRTQQSVYFQQKAHMGGGGKPYVLRSPTNPRGKNEWDLTAEETLPSKMDVFIGEFLGGLFWFVVFVSAYNDKGKAFGLYQPWLEKHH